MFLQTSHALHKPIAAPGEGVGFLKVCRLPGVKLPDSDSDGITNEKEVVTGKSDNLDSFTKEFIQAIARHRHWDREGIDKVPA